MTTAKFSSTTGSTITKALFISALIGALCTSLLAYWSTTLGYRMIATRIFAFIGAMFAFVGLVFSIIFFKDSSEGGIGFEFYFTLSPMVLLLVIVVLGYREKKKEEEEEERKKEEEDGIEYWQVENISLLLAEHRGFFRS